MWKQRLFDTRCRWTVFIILVQSVKLTWFKMCSNLYTVFPKISLSARVLNITQASSFKIRNISLYLQPLIITVKMVENWGNSIYIWKRPEQRGQRGRHELVRACAIPDRLTSKQPRWCWPWRACSYSPTGRTSGRLLRTVWAWESSSLDVKLEMVANK